MSVYGRLEYVGTEQPDDRSVIWHNTLTGLDYIFDPGTNRWIAPGFAGAIVDAIDVVDPIRDYDRAMRIV